MSVRAKFKCTVIAPSVHKDVKHITLEAVGSKGSPENAAFFKYTPAGTISLSCVLPVASEQFHVGQEFYVDFTAASEPPPEPAADPPPPSADDIPFA